MPPPASGWIIEVGVSIATVAVSTGHFANTKTVVVSEEHPSSTCSAVGSALLGR
jgi:hypothetical protein